MAPGPQDDDGADSSGGAGAGVPDSCCRGSALQRLPSGTLLNFSFDMSFKQNLHVCIYFVYDII